MQRRLAVDVQHEDGGVGIFKEDLDASQGAGGGCDVERLVTMELSICS